MGGKSGCGTHHSFLLVSGYPVLNVPTALVSTKFQEILFPGQSMILIIFCTLGSMPPLPIWERLHEKGAQ